MTLMNHGTARCVHDTVASPQGRLSWRVANYRPATTKAMSTTTWDHLKQYVTNIDMLYI